jgi:hypothetical protein
LYQWLNVVDSLEDATDLYDWFPLVANDAISGLAHLHGKGVAHRHITF